MPLLYGLSWIEAFGLKLPPGLHKIKESKAEKREENRRNSTDINELVEEFSTIFEKKTGKIRKFQAKIHLKLEAMPIALPQGESRLH